MIGTASVSEHAAPIDPGDTVIAVGTADQHSSRHLPGARFIPLLAIRLLLSEPDCHEPVFVVCATGARALQASQYLNERRYTARNLEGGLPSRRSHGMTIRTGMDAAVFA